MLAKWLGGMLLIGLLVYAGWNIYSVQKSPKEGTEEGMKAPDFTLDTLSGKSISLSDYKGKKCSLISGRRGASRAEWKCPICRSRRKNILILR